MGILNITPDSFYDGGKYYSKGLNIEKVISDAIKMESYGADFIDVGGESTRPGSDKITVEEELQRVIPVIEAISKVIKIPISIDTYKSEVAREALKAGAEIVNDISGFKFDKNMPGVVSEFNATCVLMHIKGTPKNMQSNPEYENVLTEVFEYLSESINLAKREGINQIITDPGICFGKNLEHNLSLLKNLGLFRKLNYPVLLGISNKSFIDKILPIPLDQRLSATIAANTIGIMKGANIIRVHDVKENYRAMKLTDEIKFKTV